MGKVPAKTPEIVIVAVQTESYERIATGTQIEPILTQHFKEQHAILVEVATQTEVVPSYNLAF